MSFFAKALVFSALGFIAGYVKGCRDERRAAKER